MLGKIQYKLYANADLIGTYPMLALAKAAAEPFKGKGYVLEIRWNDAEGQPECERWNDATGSWDRVNCPV
jgi:hypothetical protein